MRYFLIIFLLIASTASADIYLIVEKTTKEIVSLSPQDDAVLPAGNYDKIVVPGEVEDLGLTEAATDYRYVNKRFVKNSEKISAREEARIDGDIKSSELLAIHNHILKAACLELEAAGTTFKEVDCDADFK